MSNKLTHSWALPPVWIRFLVIVLLLLGIFFRFVNLDRKVYWFDETFTSLRISGYTEAEVVNQVCNGKQIGIEDLQKYQRLAPDKTLTDTIKSLATEDSQHPPLYYVMTRFWVQWFGNSVAVTRSLSALISLLVFPCIYWLCLELFNSSLVGWVAIGLIAVSPFHILYAQEAREYSLWTVTILLSSAALLRAIRLNTKFSWGMYAVTMMLGLYSFLFSGLVAIGHGIYVVVTESFQFSKTVTNYLLASLLTFLVFTPWLLVVITQSSQVSQTTAWTSYQMSRLNLVKTWWVNLGYFFFDFSLYINNYPWVRYLSMCLRTFILILVGYSIYFLCRNTSKQVWLFVLTLIGTTGLALIIPDLILEGQRSKTSRYLLPCYLGIQLAFAYLISNKITFISIKGWSVKVWRVITITLITLGVLSCALGSQAETSWHKDLNYYTPQVVHIINKYQRPFLISFCQKVWALGDEMPLSYLLAPKVQLQLVQEPNMPKIPDNFSDVFLLDPPLAVQSSLEREHHYKIKPVDNENLKLWKIEKSDN